MTPSGQIPPRIVSFAQLRATLLPVVSGFAWAEDSLHDLWKLGAPIPGQPGQAERRILLPQKFLAWWGEVQQRMGVSTPGEMIYSRTNAIPHTRAPDSVITRKAGDGKVIYLPTRRRP